MTAIKLFPGTHLAASLLLLAGVVAVGQSASLAQRVASAQPVDSPDARQARTRMDLHDIGAGQTLHLTVGHSTVLHGVSPMRRIYIGNPAVLQSFTAGPSEVVLTAKTPGISSLVIWDTLGKSCLYTVAADVDPDALRQSLAEAYPTSHIEVKGGEGRIYLAGTVPTQEVADGAAKLAVSYAKDIVSSLRVTPVHGKQVQLKLRIVEVDRSKMEQYGINFTGMGATPFSVTTGQFPSTITPNTATSGTSGSSATSVLASDVLNVFLYSQKLNFGATIRDLEQKQVLQVLAEPTLTALSGQSAKFLSGGEFPFPIVEGSSAPGSAPIVTIQFRPYGVKVDFTPTVNADGSILLKVAPEVSTLDYSNAVTISGYTVPALSTRRAETEVEIKSGQSFALSGLLDHRTTENLSQIPGISGIPILGKLFVSKSYSHSVVELVVMVTATLVDPLTDTTAPVQPQFVVPNMDNQSFDSDLSKEQKIQPRKP